MQCTVMRSLVLLSLATVVAAAAAAGSSASSTNTITVAASIAECPHGKTCLTLSHLISRPHLFTSNTKVIFLEGVHLFAKSEPLVIRRVDNLMLAGDGGYPEESVGQSPAIIACPNGTQGGLYFADSTNIVLKKLTFLNCGAHYNYRSGVSRPIASTNGVYYYSVDYAAVFLINVMTVSLHHISIQNSTGYGLALVDCSFVNITGSNFAHNYQVGQSWTSNEGNAALLFRGKHGAINNSIFLSNSNFTEGFSTKYSGGLMIGIEDSSVTAVLKGLVFLKNSGHIGGGLSLSVMNSESGRVMIDNCHFSRGHALTGGAMFVYAGNVTALNFTVANSILAENFAKRANHIEFISRSLGNSEHALSILNSHILQTNTPKQAKMGVSIIVGYKCLTYIVIQNTLVNLGNSSLSAMNLFTDTYLSRSSVSIQNATFTGNSNTKSVLNIRRFNAKIINTTFTNNNGKENAITITTDEISEVCIANSTITNNAMTGLSLMNSIGQFLGINIIENNTGIMGGGIRLVQMTSCLIVQGKLFIRNNKALKFGGGILHQQFYAATDYNSINPQQCTVSVEDDGNSALVFDGNRAGGGGSDIFGGILNNCWDAATRTVHMTANDSDISSNAKLMKHYKFINTNPLSSLSTEPILVCHCSTSLVPDCSQQDILHFQVYPGEEIAITIATVGYYGGTSSGIVLIEATNGSLIEPAPQLATTSKCSRLSLRLMPYQGAGSTSTLVRVKVADGKPDWGVSINVTILDCPLGFVLDQLSGQCQCEELLEQNTESCNVSKNFYTITRSGNKWISYLHEDHCLTMPSCPFDYCDPSLVTFNLTKAGRDYQCQGNRTGVLCGQCSPGLSLLLGSNACAACSNKFLYMLVAFAVAGVVLVAVLLVLNLTVSVGTINGLLFYANMVKLNEAFFFPNGNVPVVSQFISWLNLDLGINVCFFDGLDGYWKTWLQFAFPTYLFFIMGAIIVGCRYSTRLCRLCGSHSVPALATLFLISYTKILRAVTDSLSMVKLTCNASSLTVWAIDGSVGYLTTKHIPLVVFSGGVLVLSVLYPVLLLLAPLVEKHSSKCFGGRWDPVVHLKPLLDAYGGSHKDKYRSWPGVMLLIRLILNVVFSFTSGNYRFMNSYIITVIIVGILYSWALMNGVYRLLYVHLINSLFLLNLALLCLSTSVLHSFPLEVQHIGTVVSVGVAMATTIAILICHCYLKWKINFVYCANTLFISQNHHEDHENIDEVGNANGGYVGSPPSQVYGSMRGQHRFDFLLSPNGPPVLMAREPLLSLNTP